MLELMLVPLDTSTLAEQALPHAVDLARRADAKVRLVYVRTAPLDYASDDDAEKYLAMISAQLEPERPGAVTHVVLKDEAGPFHRGAPLSSAIADAIARHATEWGAHMIVMATHGRGGARASLSGVADSLIRVAPCPVLLIWPTDAAGGADQAVRQFVTGAGSQFTVHRAHAAGQDPADTHPDRNAARRADRRPRSSRG